MIRKARPIGAARTRFRLGPWPAYRRSPQVFLVQACFWLVATTTALAIAERSIFSMSRASDFFVKRRIRSASPAFLPRMYPGPPRLLGESGRAVGGAGFEHYRFFTS